MRVKQMNDDTLFCVLLIRKVGFRQVTSRSHLKCRKRPLRDFLVLMQIRFRYNITVKCLRRFLGHQY